MTDSLHDRLKQALSGIETLLTVCRRREQLTAGQIMAACCILADVRDTLKIAVLATEGGTR